MPLVAVRGTDSWYQRYGKRFIDLTVGSILALLALPIIALLAIICAIVLRANPIFVQERIGRGQEIIRFPKLRSLPRTIPGTIDKYSLAVSGVHIPRFSRFIRATHLDELPQLLLVPIGRMSLVGPRPEMRELLCRYPEEFAEARHRARPGCTGFWQVGTANHRLIYEAPEFDLAYLDNLSFGVDAWLLWRTLLIFVSRGRARVSVKQIPQSSSGSVGRLAWDKFREVVD